MSRQHALTEAEECNYHLSNPWNRPIGDLREYIRPFHVGPYQYSSIPGGQLVSSRLIGLENHWRPLEETLPFAHLRPRSRWALRVRSVLPASLRLTGAACCLLDLRQWHDGYFHWFFDTLPRVLAAEHHARTTGEHVSLLVPATMKGWQEASLRLLGWDECSWIRLEPAEIATSLSAATLLAAPSARRQGKAGAPYDAMCPGMIRLLAERLTGSLPEAGDGVAIQRIYISRSDASARRVRNETAIRSLLEHHGFSRVCLDGLPLEDQIRLFRPATHIVAVHGAALTNLLFAQKARVLEIFPEGHGIRPDYFQLASIRGLAYVHDVQPSINQVNDIELDPLVLEDFLSLSL